MADYIYTRLTIGGRISVANWQRLLDLIDDAFTDEDFETALCRKLRGVQRDTSFGGEVAWGNPGDDLKALCQELGLAYRITNDAKYEFDADTVSWFPGDESERTCTATVDGEPILTLSQLRAFAESGATIDVVIALLARHAMPIPPLEIVEDADEGPDTSTDDNT